MITEKILTSIFLILCALFLMGSFKTFLRTGLKGELLRTTGIIFFVLSYFIKNIILGIVGFVIFNIGWIFLVTFEHDKRRELYRQTTIIDRLIGNVPRIRGEKDFESAYKPIIGLLTGICCILIALILIKRATTFKLMEVIYIGLLAFAGIFFVVFTLIKKKKKN